MAMLIGILQFIMSIGYHASLIIIIFSLIV